MRSLNLLLWTGHLLRSGRPITWAAFVITAVACAGTDPVPSGHLTVSPTSIDFAWLDVAGSPQWVTLHNGTDHPVTVASVAIEGDDPGFCAGPASTGQEAFIAWDPEAGVTRPGLPSIIAPGLDMYWRVAYQPCVPSRATATLTFGTSDGEVGVELAGGTEPTAPKCEVVSPDPIDFGPVVTGTSVSRQVPLQTCAGQLLVLRRIELVTTSTSFHLRPSDGLGSLPTAEAPAYLRDGDHPTVSIAYEPTTVTDGPETATLQLVFDGLESPIVLPLSGSGRPPFGTPPADCAALSPTGCPIALGEVDMATVLSAPTRIQLYGAASCSPTGKSLTYAWTVDGPDVLRRYDLGRPDVANTSLLAWSPGSYHLRLDVKDETGTPACAPWEQDVVVSAPTLYVVLTWRTPNDVDETDEGAEAGSDLDVHFANLKYAVGGGFDGGFDGDGDGVDDPWFHQPYDCFWYNAHPNWGVFNPTAHDDPDYWGDDSDGAGPELLRLDEPQAGIDYGVAVHYKRDYGFGDAFATVRIYVNGALALEESDVRLSQVDLWNVATISWPSGAVTPTQRPDGTHHITPNYQNPYFIRN